MRRVVIDKPGGFDRLRLGAAPDLTPKPGDVVVRTQAVGVNYADCVVRMGLYQSAKDFVGWPITPGFEFAGTVVSVGPGVTRWKLGDRVLGVTRFSAYATQVAVPQHQLFAIPDGLDMAQAATFPVMFLTAHYALFDLANVRLPGPTKPSRPTRVLVHSAAGGVGGALLQLAKLACCQTVGVVGGASKIDSARAFGADHVIDKRHENLWRSARRHAPEGYDVVLDANGAETLRGSYEHLASPGKLVVYGFHSMFPRSKGRPDYAKLAIDFLRTPRFSPLTLTNDNKSVLAFNLSYLFHRDDILGEAMNRLLGWVARGEVRPAPVQTFPFDRVADAHRALESGTTVGKLALLTEAG